MLGYVNALLLLLFFAMLLGRTLMLLKKGVRVIVFGLTNKTDFLLVPMMMVFAYSVLACSLEFPAPKFLIRPLVQISVLHYIGIAFCWIALVGFEWSLISFGDSFRVGIDTQSPDKLVTTGVFAFSRNPIYVCFALFFTGMLISFPNLILLAVWLVFLGALHRQALREEKFLRNQYGQEYLDYCKKVRRYIGITQKAKNIDIP